MLRSRSRHFVVGLVAGVIAASTISIAQARGNDPGSARSVSLRTPRGGVGAGHRVLIYGPTLAERKAVNERSVARRLGFRVKVVTKAEWSAMTEDDFSAFSAIVFGDPFCRSNVQRLEAAIANLDTWSAAVEGNVVVGTFDAVWHANMNKKKPGPERLIANSLRFTGLGDGTGLNVSLSCYYVEADPETPVELLSGIGDFTVNSLGGNCNNIKVPDPNHPLLRRLSADLLSHWRCSTHGTLDGVPAGFDVVATRRTGVPVLVARTVT